MNENLYLWTSQPQLPRDFRYGVMLSWLHTINADVDRPVDATRVWVAETISNDFSER